MMRNSDPPPIEPGTGSLRLYAAWGCPFSHRVLAGLHMTDLVDRMAITWMNDIKRDDGWEIEDGADPVFGVSFIKAVYAAADPGQDHRPAVPLLVEEQSRRLVSTESPAILRFVSTGFAGQYPTRIDLCPADLREEINALNSWLHDHINRAVYTVGFAQEQSDYEDKAFALFQNLDAMEQRTVWICFSVRRATDGERSLPLRHLTAVRCDLQSALPVLAKTRG